MPTEDLMATLERSFADELWSPDGMILPEAWETGSTVVRTVDILETDVGYDEIIDMQFVRIDQAAN
jgi:NitT/TauT family transport system substrate-binding protein